MGRYVAGRIAQAGLVVLLVSVGVFVLIRAVPGGPELLLYPELPLDEARRFREQLGLDEPVFVQYARWIAGLAQGQLGVSYRYNLPVVSLLANRLPASFLLAGLALTASIILSLSLGILAAVKRGSPIDRLVNLLSAVGLSVPPFWTGIVLIIVFTVYLQWLPPGGTGGPQLIDQLRYLVLPVTVLAILSFSELVRYVRSAFLGELGAAYVTTARSKGLDLRAVVSGHILRNALIPIVTIVGLQIRTIASGAVITETLFAWPGMGRLAFDAVVNRDYPVIMGVVLAGSVLVVLTNLVVDLMYGYIDPRVRFS